MAHPDVYLEIKNTLFVKLLIPYDISESYKTLLSDGEPSPKMFSTKPLKSTDTRCLTND